ncbi:MAG TPA: serine/threonine-protein kinase [Rhodanobacteraceae bacterium]|nr:serine/threonine-protein kinase [Rhodanobacteraceae bacterium]
MTGNSLDPQRWQRLSDLFDRALELDNAGREALLTDIDDEPLRAELERMLAADAGTDSLNTTDAKSARAQIEQLLREADGVSLLGRRMGPWRIERLLGSGGMGRVFLAVRDDGEFEQRVALKVLRTELIDGLARRRFLEERRVLAKLAHPRIARLLDGGLGPDGEPWYAMEYVDGAPLTDWCDARRLSIAQRLELFCKVCEAVDFAHRHLVIHRDLKPGNILVDANGEPKLLDFGIAKLLPAPDAQTRSDTRMMTPEYAAPEQLRNEAVSTATDVYALGAVLFELLTGQRPFPDPLASRDPPSALRACSTTDPHTGEHAAERATSPRNLRKTLRGDIERSLRGALDPDPAHRYQSAAALASDLREHLQGRPISLRRDRAYRLGKFVRRNRVSVAAASLVLATLIGATAYSVRQAQLAHMQAARANTVRDFVVGVFEQTDPDARQGKPITAHELLDHGNRQLNQGSIDSDASRTEMQGLIGHLYWLIGDYSKAASLMRDAVAHPGATTPKEVRARNLLYLAQSELQKNLFATARAHATAARGLALEAGNTGADTASAARRIYAESLTDDGNPGAADTVLKTALQEDSAQFGGHSEAVADDLTHLASAAQELTHYKESIAYSDRAIAAETILHGRESAGVINNLSMRAVTEGYAGDLPSAERDAREVAALTTKLYGPTQVETISARSELYFFYFREERYAQALAGHLDLLKLSQPLAQVRPEQLAYLWNYIAADYLGLARYDDALQAEQASLSAWARVRSPDPDYASNDSRTQLGKILTAMGRFDEAAATFRQAIRIEGKNEPSDSEWLNRDLGFLGNVYRLQHRYPEAIAVLTKALRALSPESHSTPMRAFLQLLLAEAQLDSGDVAAAEKTASQAEQTNAPAFSHQPLALSRIQYVSARVALARNRPADAERLLRSAYSARATLARNDPQVVEVQVELIRALEMQGKQAEAQPLRAAVMPILNTSHSPYFADLRRQLTMH